jgi:hypothetical protein
MDTEKMIAYWRALRNLADSMINALEAARLVQQQSIINETTNEGYRNSLN